MKNKFYPFLWTLKYQKKYNIHFSEYNPYFELSSEGLNVSNQNYYLNLSYLNLSNDFNEKILRKYIDVYIKVKHSLVLNRFNILMGNDDIEISKYLIKKRYVFDKIYIFKNAVKQNFFNNIIYLKENTFYIYLDYEKTLENEQKIKKIIEYFLPLEFRAVYFFEHFVQINNEKLKELERFVVL